MLHQVNSTSESNYFTKVKIENMSTDCETIIAQALGRQALHHSTSQLSSNGMSSNGHAPEAISYEGRLSLISPHTSYGMSIRSALLMEEQNSQSSTSFVHNQISNFLNQNHSGDIKPNSLSANDDNGSQNYYDKFPQEYKTNLDTIKLEQPEPSTQQINEETPSSSSPPPLSPYVSQEKNPEPIRSEGHVEEPNSPIEGTSSDPPSPYRFPSQEEHCMDSDPEGASTYMDSSFEANHLVPIDHGENSKSLKCNYCSFSSDSEFHFQSHVNTHFDHKCMKCDYTATTVLQLKDHLQSEHELSAEDAASLEGMKIPRITAQGKVKTFKCKQCGYVSITKDDFWSHQRTHIKSDKLLSCKKCPFVTEYKHHLEYHMRNHTGSKPYKCKQCSYSCVNKSMLNSHMKSHSTVYQYRCSDCSYATKYCHSLKLHLRKYRHNPAMVLNPDGSPNPVPIIDIYGTRRGPKLKKDENGMPIMPPQYQLQAHFVRAHMEATGTIPPAPTIVPEKGKQNKSLSHMPFQPSQPAFPNPFSFGNYPSFIPREFQRLNERAEIVNSSNKEENLDLSKSPEVQEEPVKCDSCNFSTPNKNVLAHHQLLHQRQQINSQEQDTSYKQEEEKNNIQPSFESQPPSPFSTLNSFTNSSTVAQNQMQNMQEYLSRAITSPFLYQQLLASQRFQNPTLDLQQQLIQRLLYENGHDGNSVAGETSMPQSPSPVKEFSRALDLSKEQTPPNAVSSSQSALTPSSDSTSTSSVMTPPPKSRRKGKAFKIERIALRLSGGEDGGRKENEGKELQQPLQQSKESPEESLKKWMGGDFHACQYCDIVFKDVVLHTMHMGYHGFSDAFTCNHCGYKADNKIDFFVHIARAAHI